MSQNVQKKFSRNSALMESEGVMLKSIIEGTSNFQCPSYTKGRIIRLGELGQTFVISLVIRL